MHGKVFIQNPQGFLGTVRTTAWHVQERVALVGDAAHAIVPFFGQGTNCGFEDCLQLVSQLDARLAGGAATAAKLGECFPAFTAARVANANAIADMAMENYDEMQAKTADPVFQLQRDVELLLEARWPDRYRTRYAMVCYGGGVGGVSYSSAQQLGAVQSGILAELAEGIDTAEQVDYEKADRLLRTKLAPMQAALKVDLGTVSHDMTPDQRRAVSKL